ncbi:MAG: CCA tRNA nucleotidyltransferase [Chlamydiales bacterium]|nr:CCA tRNA nucleotidyltransferase [Chlamydiales bacterium]
MSKAHLEAAKAVVKKLVDAGHTAYFAGGWVRDHLMKIPSDDIDIATTAKPDEVAKLFEKTIPVGVNFGVVIVVIQEHAFEVATFRSDRAYIDGRRPVGIDPACPEEDAQRRDFTINGMFYDPFADVLYDYVDGKRDIIEGVIRAIGNPHDRFAEDRLRMVRAVRYAARFHFVIESATLQAIIDHSPELLNAVAVERLWQELEKMARYPNFEIALITMHRLGLLQVILPELGNTDIETIHQRLQHIPHFPIDAPMIAGLLELFPNSSLEEKLKLCDHFKVSNSVKAFVEAYHAHVKQLYIDTQLDDYEWSKTYAEPNFSISFQLAALKLDPESQATFVDIHQKRQKRLKECIERIRSRKPILKAQDLEEVGIKPGKEMGLLLQEGEKLSVNEQLFDPKLIIKRLQETPLWPKG